jgi:hypothetical protein
VLIQLIIEILNNLDFFPQSRRLLGDPLEPVGHLGELVIRRREVRFSGG